MFLQTTKNIYWQKSAFSRHTTYQIPSKRRCSIIPLDLVFHQTKLMSKEVIQHPFHSEMVKGTLCSERFKEFVIQDVLFLEKYLESIKIAQKRFAQEHQELFELMINGNEVELEKYQELRTKLTQNEIVTINKFIMNKACEEYAYFLTELTKNGSFIEIIGAIWACYSAFLEMNQVYIEDLKFLNPEHPYYELVIYYKEMTDIPSAEGIKKTISQILNIAPNSFSLREQFFNNFQYASNCEIKFYDSIYDSAFKLNGTCVTTSIASIKERLLSMPKGSWVIWDLDDTVWTPELAILRMINNDLLKKYISVMQPAYPNIRELIWELYYYCDYRLIEKEILELFLILKKQGIHVIALTKREIGFSPLDYITGDISRQDLTLCRLNQLGMVFSQLFPDDLILIDSNNNNILFKKGVFFTSNFNKGKALKIIIDEAVNRNITLPPEITLIDDIYHENIRDVRIVFDRINSILLSTVHYVGQSRLNDNDNINYDILTQKIQQLLAIQKYGVSLYKPRSSE